MEPVQVSRVGTIRNILSLNYDSFTIIMEYLNNVLSKNQHSEYAVRFTLHKMKSHCFGFNFIENNAVGFKNLDEIKRAFNIADSDRCGTNNTGFGIYSPITEYPDHDSFNVFIQDTDNGQLYSISLYIHDDKNPSIITIQGEYTDNKIFGEDISVLEIKNGTRSIWFSVPTYADDFEYKKGITEIDILKRVKKYMKKINNPDSILYNEDIHINDLGKYYFDHLKSGLKMYYADELIEPIDILRSDDTSKEHQKSYNLSIVKGRSSEDRFDYRIKEDKLDEWQRFTKNSTNPLGRDVHRRSAREYEQKATLHIHDIAIPENKNNERSKNRKVFVKIDKTIICYNEFPLQGHPNIRVVLTLENTGNNNFDAFIAPNPNKFNSKINNEVLERITSLTRWCVNNPFSRVKNDSTKIPPKVRQEVWKTHFGKMEEVCHIDWCTSTIDPWNFHVGHNIPSSENGSNKIDNLRPICSECNKGMSNRYTIDDWNKMVPV